MGNSAELQAVNERLERGEGWIGYLYTKKDGVKVPSKFLYIQFYAGDEQKRINTKTNDPEAAYRMLLDNRRRTDEGERVLPSEAANLKYEDLIEALMDYYRADYPASLRTRKTEDGGTEETFDGKDNLDAFFRGMSITQITATKIQEYIRKHTKMGYKGGRFAVNCPACNPHSNAPVTSTSDAKAALLKVGQYSTSKVAAIREAR